MKEMMVSPEFRGLTYVDEADMEKDAVKGVIKKLLGGEGEEEKPLSPPLSESLSSPGEGGGVTKKAAEETAPPKKRGRPKKIIVVTHIPPFKEACMHKGKESDDHWLPYFSSKATGDVLTKIAQENPDIEFLVLCGHTHSQANYQPFENLIVKAGKAKYYQPTIQEIIDA